MVAREARAEAGEEEAEVEAEKTPLKVGVVEGVRRRPRVRCNDVYICVLLAGVFRKVA